MIKKVVFPGLDSSIAFQIADPCDFPNAGNSTTEFVIVGDCAGTLPS